LNYRERQEIIAKSPISFSYLKKFNLGAGILHLSQGIIMLALGTLLTWERDIYTFYLKLDITPGPPPVFNIAPDPQVWFTLSYLGVIVASFPLLLIATFVGVWDFWSLVMIFVLNAMMIMFGYFMELVNQKTEKTSWSAFLVGCISGGVPWVVLFAYFIAAIMSTGTEPPAFVYSIFFIYFAVFNVFALNMVLQYKGVGRWRDYLYGERVYIILSFVAKTALAWLVFIGVFAPF